MRSKFHNLNNTWMTKFYFPIVASDLCPLPSTFSPLTFSFQTSPFTIKAINTALLHNALSVKRLQYYVSMPLRAMREKFMTHDGMFVFNHCEVIAESFA